MESVLKVKTDYNLLLPWSLIMFSITGRGKGSSATWQFRWRYSITNRQLSLGLGISNALAPSMDLDFCTKPRVKNLLTKSLKWASQIPSDQ